MTAQQVTTQEATLLEAVRRGDRGAFAALVQAHQSAVYGFLRARLLENADAEDLCQEVFLRCFVGRERVNGEFHIRSWLIGIARNVLYEHVRRSARRREVAWTELCLDIDRLAEIGEDRHYDEAMSHLPGCLDNLGDSAREALNLKYHQKLRHADIGRKMDRSEGAIKLLLFRARQALRRCLNGRL